VLAQRLRQISGLGRGVWQTRHTLRQSEIILQRKTVAVGCSPPTQRSGGGPQLDTTKLEPRCRVAVPATLKSRKRSAQRIAIARRFRAAVALAYPAMGTDCGLLRRFVDAPRPRPRFASTTRPPSAGFAPQAIAVRQQAGVGGKQRPISPPVNAALKGSPNERAVGNWQEAVIRRLSRRARNWLVRGVRRHEVPSPAYVVPRP